AIIADATIGSAKITDYLQSTNWVSNTTGIRIGMRTGQIEINGAVAGEGRLNFVNNRITVFNESNQVVVVIGKKLVV
ncbi:hypothetical protein LH412_24020, partial [Yersinia intermedia]